MERFWRSTKIYIRNFLIGQIALKIFQNFIAFFFIIILNYVFNPCIFHKIVKKNGLTPVKFGYQGFLVQYKYEFVCLFGNSRIDLLKAGGDAQLKKGPRIHLKIAVEVDITNNL